MMMSWRWYRAISLKFIPLCGNWCWLLNVRLELVPISTYQHLQSSLASLTHYIFTQEGLNRGQVDLVVETWRCFAPYSRGFLRSDLLVGCTRDLVFDIFKLLTQLISHLQSCPLSFPRRFNNFSHLASYDNSNTSCLHFLRRLKTLAFYTAKNINGPVNDSTGAKYLGLTTSQSEQEKPPWMRDNVFEFLQDSPVALDLTLLGWLRAWRLRTFTQYILLD